MSIARAGRNQSRTNQGSLIDLLRLTLFQYHFEICIILLHQNPFRDKGSCPSWDTSLIGGVEFHPRFVGACKFWDCLIGEETPTPLNIGKHPRPYIILANSNTNCTLGVASYRCPKLGSKWGRWGFWSPGFRGIG